MVMVYMGWRYIGLPHISLKTNSRGFRVLKFGSEKESLWLLLHKHESKWLTLDELELRPKFFKMKFKVHKLRWPNLWCHILLLNIELIKAKGLLMTLVFKEWHTEYLIDPAHRDYLCCFLSLEVPPWPSP